MPNGKCLSREEYLDRRNKLGPVLRAAEREKMHEALTLFDSMRKASYEDKIAYTQQTIAEAVAEYNKTLVCTCSWGKDSMLMLHFALQADPEIKVLFCDTHVEQPGTKAFRDMVVRDWHLNYFETQPQKSFWDCVDMFGLPAETRSKGNSSPHCCYHMKEKPAGNFYKANGIQAIFVGLVHDESWQRKMVIIRHGDRYRTEGRTRYAVTKIHPIAFWTTEEVWRYTRENRIPTSPVYAAGWKRTGCLPCTAHRKWREELAQLNPKMLKIIETRYSIQSLSLC